MGHERDWALRYQAGPFLLRITTNQNGQGLATPPAIVPPEVSGPAAPHDDPCFSSLGLTKGLTLLSYPALARGS